MIIHNGKTHKLKITKGLLDRYFKKAGVSPEKAKVADIRQVLLMVLKDFFDGKIGIDGLSYIGTQLYFEIGKPSWFENIDMELGKILYEVSEASWYKIKNHKKYKNMESQIKKYFDKNKNLPRYK